jgi:hypothetical protein
VNPHHHLFHESISHQQQFFEIPKEYSPTIGRDLSNFCVFEQVHSIVSVIYQNQRKPIKIKETEIQSQRITKLGYYYTVLRKALLKIPYSFPRYVVARIFLYFFSCSQKRILE